MNVRFGAQIAQAAAAHHLDPRLLAAVAAQETGGPGSDSGRNIVGDGGHGRGIFQIDDRSWAFARSRAAMDPAKNADMAATILAENLRASGGDIRAALSTYNSGSPTARGTLTTWEDGTTLGYADSVMRHYDALGSDPSRSASQPFARATGPSHVASVTVQALETEQARAALFASQSPAGSFAMPLGPMQSTATQLAAPTPWDKLSGADSADSKEALAADHALADIIDSGDIFDDETSDDS